jgi:hypothetical protein
MPFQKNICTYDKLNLYAEPINSVDELHSTIYNMHTEFSMANVGSRKSECLGMTSYAWKILVPGIDGY